MTHPEGTIFVVSSYYRALNVGDMRTFTVEADAWEYFRRPRIRGRCWATYPDKEPVLLSTKAYMRAKGIPE